MSSAEVEKPKNKPKPRNVNIVQIEAIPMPTSDMLRGGTRMGLMILGLGDDEMIYRFLVDSREWVE